MVCDSVTGPVDYSWLLFYLFSASFLVFFAEFSSFSNSLKTLVLGSLFYYIYSLGDIFPFSLLEVLFTSEKHQIYILRLDLYFQL